MYRLTFLCLSLAAIIIMGCSCPAYAAEYNDETGQSYEDTMFPENRNHDDERAIQSIDSGAVVNPASVNKRMGIYDILTWIALIFTLVSVIVLWIINTVKNHKDPLRKYKL